MSRLLAHIAVAVISLAYAQLSHTDRSGLARLTLAGLFAAALAPILAQDIAAYKRDIEQYHSALATAKAILNEFDPSR